MVLYSILTITLPVELQF